MQSAFGSWISLEAMQAKVAPRLPVGLLLRLRVGLLLHTSFLRADMTRQSHSGEWSEITGLGLVSGVVCHGFLL
jgi:hypothetical protein